MSKSLFKIPRKISPAAKPYWTLVRQHGYSRAAMVNFITGIGGYGDRRNRFAIEFNCKAHYFDLTFEKFWGLVYSEGWYTEESLSASPENPEKALCQSVYVANAEKLFGWGIESAGENFLDQDHAENFTGKPIPTDWEFHGRSGGHLCMKACAGIYLIQHPEDLEADLLERENYPPRSSVIDIERVKDLFIACVQATVEITPQEASLEVEYQAAYILWQICGSAISEHREHCATQETFTQQEKLVQDYLTATNAEPDVVQAFYGITYLGRTLLSKNVNTSN